MHIVITGANRGIGLALSTRYSDRGDTVTGTSRDGSAQLRLDVTDPAQHAAFAEQLRNQPVDLLICNAGVYLDKGHTINDYPADMWAQSFATNVTGVFLTVQALLPNLQASRGKVAILSSQMASHTRAPGGSYIYRASKAAVLNLGRNLATDLKDDGIAVGIYHPGWVQTDMGGDAAEIDVEQAVSGLIERFDDLSLATTGCFETYDGQPHAY
ncbi:MULTISPECIES: SDR family oxidoreductase [unclassified Ruegeria]|uniref:SDR family oxidoreductase n=1 Tax=unclassified Ruegeria TaxID=2625375 RepID=UPI0014876959|nr:MULTISPECIES: SDR family oxidoreductase [unclassified Ruegeria]NOD46878.1 SDR family NAD(P)-dependent oxidoreductase [Ruegeria sp. HKCCD5849]NOD51201.1 SDR family NAD(P)-dependent oxidoreductase [Ruegeria sp. HKCCD5851]NOD68020.1 SDR family NAD(P)-dependent oxidoreductase [Ruegeria sp. HKCCD7303]NOE33556.1 SDR family NAD(P)-dependent oxidoreductase [Ruegeria sp. HKCCD7318]